MALLIDLRTSHLNVMALGAATPPDPADVPSADILWFQAWLPVYDHGQLTRMGLIAPRHRPRPRVGPSEVARHRGFDQFSISLLSDFDFEFSTFYCPRVGRRYQARCQVSIESRNRVFPTAMSQLTFRMNGRHGTLLHVIANYRFGTGQIGLEVIRGGDLRDYPREQLQEVSVVEEQQGERRILVPGLDDEADLTAVASGRARTRNRPAVTQGVPRRPKIIKKVKEIPSFLDGAKSPKPEELPDQDLWSVLRERRRRPVQG